MNSKCRLKKIGTRNCPCWWLLASPEVIVVLYDGVSDLDAVHAAVAEGLLEQHGAEAGVEALAHVLQQARLPELDRVLDQLQVVAVRVLRGTVLDNIAQHGSGISCYQACK